MSYSQHWYLVSSIDSGDSEHDAWVLRLITASMNISHNHGVYELCLLIWTMYSQSCPYTSYPVARTIMQPSPISTALRYQQWRPGRESLLSHQPTPVHSHPRLRTAQEIQTARRQSVWQPSHSYHSACSYSRQTLWSSQHPTSRPLTRTPKIQLLLPPPTTQYRGIWVGGR